MIPLLLTLGGVLGCGPEEPLQSTEELQLERGSVIAREQPDPALAAPLPAPLPGAQGQLEGIPWHDDAPMVTGWACVQRHAAPLPIRLFVEAGELLRPLERTAGGEPSRERVLLDEGMTDWAAGTTLASVCGVSSEAKVRFRIPVSRNDWLAHAGRRVVAVATTNRGELVLSSHRPLRLPPPPAVIGRAELVPTCDRAVRLQGWACQPHVPRPVEVRLSLDEEGRTPFFSGLTSVVPDELVRSACHHASQVAVGFSIDLPEQLVEAHAGAQLFVHAVRPLGGQLDGPFAVAGQLSVVREP